MTGGFLSVQLFERKEDAIEVQQRGETETMVTAVDVSYGDNLMSVAFDHERNEWTVEFSGRAVIYANKG